MNTATIEADPRVAIGGNNPPEEAALTVTDLIAQTPSIFLTDEQKRAELFAKIEADIAEFVPDLATAKGRAAIKSFAFDITKMKTSIDAAGKAMNEDARAQINVVDAARRVTKTKLDALADKARTPLTEWEEAETKRADWCRSVIDSFKAGMVVTMDDTAATVRARGSAAFNVILSPETFGDMLDEAQAAKDLTVSTLKVALARLTKEEADKAELEKLRAEAAERDRADADRRAAEEAERQRIWQERAAEERRVAAEKADADRLERARQEAAEQARRDAEESARKEREEAERAQQAELNAANERARHAEEAAQRQREDAERAEQERFATAQREEAERQRREADQAHRTAVKSAAKTAIMTCGVDEETARKIVTLIIAGEVPNIRMEF